MDSILKSGTVLKSFKGNEYIVKRLTGTSGNGEYYLVDSASEKLALKMYYKSAISDKFISDIEKKILKGTPGLEFAWPIDFYVSEELYGCFFKIRDERFKSMADFLRGKISPTFETLCNVGINLASVYEKIHKAGLVCLSEFIVWFDPNNGEVFVSDFELIDFESSNVKVLGTARYLAPEIVRREGTISRVADLHTLAIQLFYLLMMSHPYEGRLECNLKYISIKEQLMLYGNPIYIWDKNDSQNRPVNGCHDNAIVYRNIYPEFIMDLFYKTFVDGAKNPLVRVGENEWINAFDELKKCIRRCECGADSFIGSKLSECWNCHKPTNSLASIVNAYPNVWENSKLMKALLMDYYPEDKLTRNLIFSSVEEKIPHDIVGLKVCSKSDYRRFVKRLTDSYGCVETKAEEIMGLWFKALAVSLENAVSNEKTNTEITENKNSELEALSIDELEFNVRTYNALKRAGIRTVGDLMHLSAAEMVDIRNLGRKSFEEILRKMKSLGCVIDSHFEEEYYEQWHKKIEERRLETNRFSFSDAYDDFISKNKNSGMWDFDDVIIHRKLNRGQYVNTYFCQYDNPPIEIFNFIAKKDGNKYEMRMGVWNLSKETRNQPIKIRYEIATRQGSHIHDCVDTVTPAPKSQYLVINFEYDGEEKPIFRIIE